MGLGGREENKEEGQIGVFGRRTKRRRQGKCLWGIFRLLSGVLFNTCWVQLERRGEETRGGNEER